MSAGEISSQLLEQIEHLLETDQPDALRELLAQRHPADLAEVLGRLGHGDRRHIFELMDDELAGEIFEGLDIAVVKDGARNIPPEELSDIIEQMPPEEAADLLGDLPDEQAEQVLGLMGPVEQQQVQELLRYPEDTAGGHMHAVQAAVPEHATATEAIDLLRMLSPEDEAFYIYVVDDRQRLVGTVPLKRLVPAQPHRPLKDICNRDVIKMPAAADQEEMAAIFGKYDLVAVPVVDHDGRLVGRVLAEDIIDVIEEEATEDVYKMAGIDQDELESWSPIKVAFARLPWLLICLGGTMISALVAHLFQVTIKEIVALVMFSPAIAAMGGNTGLQTSAVAIRGMATGRLDRTNPLRHMFKEIGSALFVAIACGLLVGIAAYVVACAWIDDPRMVDLKFGAVVGVSMFTAMLTAAMLGALLPLTLRKIGIDPALASGPLLTTINDSLGLFIYLGLATLLLLTQH